MTKLSLLGLATLGLVAAVAAQSGGPFDGAPSSRPVSARVDQLTGSDPIGRGALLASLGQPLQYIGKWPYQFDPPNVGIDSSVDPGVVQPVSGNDPAENGTFKVAGNTGAIAAHLIPFANDLVLELIRPNPRLAFGGDTTSLQNQSYLLTADGKKVESAALYNLTDNTYERFHITESPLCSSHVLLPNGEAAIVGGMMVGINAPYYTIGYQAVRLVNAVEKKASLVNEMSTGRWYPSTATLADGSILIVGGAQIEMIGWGTSQSPLGMGTPEQGSSTSTVQCSGNGGNQPSDPSYATATYQILSSEDYSLSRPLALTIIMESWPINTYPFLTVLPTGSVLIIAGAQMEALHMDAEGASADEEVGQLPTLPVPVNFPQQGTMVLLPLEGPDYDAQVLIAGGSSAYCATAMSPASSKSFLVDVSAGHNHTLIEEQLNYPRIMGDAILLPDGTVFLCNGAQKGVAGGSGYGFSAADTGATVAEIYNPTKPIGQRWSTVADSQILRFYHSTAILTSNATVFIAGSETTSEHRAQVYTPAYFYRGKQRPAISAAPTTVGYKAKFDISFSGVTSVDRVVINRLASATHGVHFDQRQVVLDCASSSGKTSCTSPPNSNIAPPGQYQLFIASEGFPSQAKIITVELDNNNASPSKIDNNLGSGMSSSAYDQAVLSAAG